MYIYLKCTYNQHGNMHFTPSRFHYLAMLCL